MAEGGDVHDHIRKFFDAVDKLQEMEVVINQDQLTIMLLYSLPHSLENFRCAIETRDSLPSAEDLKIKIIEESDARNSKERENSEARLASGAGRGHYRKHFQKAKQPEKGKQAEKSFPFKCHKCKQVGHKAVNCDVKVKSSEKSAKIEGMGFLITMNQQCALKTEGTPPGTKWCLDSGCTLHMCNEKRKFIHSEACESKKLSLASSATTNIESRGTVKLLITDCDQVKSMKLEKPLYVPDLRTHLMSVGRICDKGFEVAFMKSSAVIRDEKEIQKLYANRIDGLYYLQGTPEVASAVSESDHSKVGIMAPQVRSPQCKGR